MKLTSVLAAAILAATAVQAFPVQQTQREALSPEYARPGLDANDAKLLLTQLNKRSTDSKEVDHRSSVFLARGISESEGERESIMRRGFWSAMNPAECFKPGYKQPRGTYLVKDADDWPWLHYYGDGAPQKLSWDDVKKLGFKGRAKIPDRGGTIVQEPRKEYLRRTKLDHPHRAKEDKDHNLFRLVTALIGA